MPNGDTLNWDAYREVFGWSDCELGYPGTQNIKIIPDQGNEMDTTSFIKQEDILVNLKTSPLTCVFLM
jgi:hypothetical protein